VNNSPLWKRGVRGDLKEYMKDIGLKVLRFSDKEIFNNKQGGVLEKIWRYCDS